MTHFSRNRDAVQMVEPHVHTSNMADMSAQIMDSDK